MVDKKRYVARESRKRDDTGHICHAEGCRLSVAPAMFMCRRHWFMVPRELRDRVWKLYEPGQEISKNASAEYIKTAHQAISAVARKEGRGE